MSNAHKGQVAWNKGIPLQEQMSKETNDKRKQKISIGLKKAYINGTKKRLIGRIKTEQELTKQSASLKKAYKEGRMPKGDKHWNWKNGVTSNKKKIFRSLKYKLWRNAIFKRDNWTCQKCNQIGGKIQADHIKRWSDYPELVFDLNNGQTLCLKCHRIKTGKENAIC